jgi:putative DNA primase/helicase
MYHERHQGNGAFGGLMLENITQAFCRDIFVAAMPKLEAAGYAIVMHTHDEWCCEVPNDRGSLDEFLAIVTTPPPWAADLPIAAKARISDRLIEIPEPVQAVAVVADNAIDNAMADLQEGETEDEDDAERDDNEADSVEPDIVEQMEVIPDAAAPVAPMALPAPQLHICAYCQHEPDGTERPSAYENAWLHPGCFDAFAKAKMAEQGIAWSAAPELLKTSGRASEGSGAAPSAASGANGHATNGNGGTDNDGLNTFEIAEFLQPRTVIQLQGARDDYPHGESAAPSAGPTTAEYIYKDARGRLYMRVVRTAGHTFPTYHFSDGAWVSGWPQRVVPYRLPELLASSPDTVVLVCEGEKDADTAVHHGFVATTNPGGAAKWQPELAQYFQGKQRVCIVEDNDAMGAKNTATIVKALGNVVPTIGVVRFPELGRGGDLSDYFERDGSKPYLVTRIEEALRQGSARNYTLINLHECPLEAQTWLWKGHLPIGALELLTGAPGVGKSLLQCDFITTITTGRNWPDGASGPQPGQVIALTAEDRASDYRRRLTAAGADLTKVKLLSYVRRNEREELFLLSEDLDKLEQAVNDLGDVRLVAIDPITAFMGAAMDSFIGSQAFIAAARVGHYCASELGSEDERGHRRPTGRVLFATPKASHSAAMPTLAYRIEEVRIGWDAERGQDITAPRVVWEGEPVDITADEAIASNKMTLGDGRKPRAAAVREFLRGLLAGGPVLYKAVVERGAARGFSVDQLKHARRAIGAVAFKRRGENISSPWLWSLLEHMPADAEPEV